MLVLLSFFTLFMLFALWLWMLIILLHVSYSLVSNKLCAKLNNILTVHPWIYTIYKLEGF